MNVRTPAATAAAIAVVAAAATLTHARDASAQARHRFEPTDLRIQQPGIAEVDLQGGISSDGDRTRVYAPDFEASVGISSHAEIEIDGALGFERDSSPELVDNTLVALRVAIFEIPDAPHSRSAWSGGVQAGPRLPTLRHARGLGIEALAIIGRSGERLHVFIQAGTLVDPANSSPTTRSRPTGVEGGIDLDLDLDAREVWSLKSELGGVKFFSAHPDQLHLTGGPAVWALPWLELSLVGIVGLLPGGDRFGMLFGGASRFRAF